jgi:hypothetical protein
VGRALQGEGTLAQQWETLVRDSNQINCLSLSDSDRVTGIWGKMEEKCWPKISSN